MDAYEAAMAMWQQEHTRWNQWALFFFGSIAAIFAFWKEVTPAIPMYVPCFLACAMSLLWVIAAQNIRSSTHSWIETVKLIEKSKKDEVKAVTAFFKLHYKYPRCKDLCQTINIFNRKACKSITRMLVLMGLGLAAIFATLAVMDILDVFKASAGPQVVNQLLIK